MRSKTSFIDWFRGLFQTNADEFAEAATPEVPYAQMVDATDAAAGDTYIAIAPPGTALATAGWQIRKITVAGAETRTTWCDGNALFDNTATDHATISGHAFS